MELFFEIPCLTEVSRPLLGIDLCKKWFKSADKRIPGEALQKFAVYNKSLFDFLEVTPFILGTDHRASISFRSTRFIGAIPLRSPDTGKQIGDFVIAPRYVGGDRFEEYVNILDLLGNEISPEFVDSLTLVSGRNFRPPFYLEAVKFINALEELIRRPWKKFDSVLHVSGVPQGHIDWTKYIRNESDARNKLRYPVRKNVLSEFHYEFSQIRFVFDLCSREILSPKTPQRVRTSFTPRISFLEKCLYLHKPLQVNQIQMRSSDSSAIKECKREANKILSRNFDDCTAWRVDFNDVFEKFVQYVFREVARTIGGKLHTNPKIHSKTTKYFSWELRHLEPDAVLRTEALIAFIDAKYKSHLFNRFDATELLKSDFRADLHQVLAYSSFAATNKKLAILCYPSNDIEIKTTTFKDSVSGGFNTVTIIGLPLVRKTMPKAISAISICLTTFLRSDNDALQAV